MNESKDIVNPCLKLLNSLGFIVLAPSGKRGERMTMTAALMLVRQGGIPGVVWRNNTGAVRQGKRFVRFGVPGGSDILGILCGGRMLAIECKQPGRKATRDQAAFLDLVDHLDGLAILVSSPDRLLCYKRQLLGKMCPA